MKRWIAEGEWVTESALHCGGAGGEDWGGVDSELVRDAGGRLTIPGSSVIGAARSYLAKRTLGPKGFAESDQNDKEAIKEDPRVGALFGNRFRYASIISTDDAHPIDAAETTGIRDGVRIDAKNGQAWGDKEGGAKFDVEIVPAGTRFGLHIELRLPDGEDEQEVLSVFGMVLEGFRKGEIRLGARSRRGYGSGRVETWRIRKIDSEAAFIDWLRRDPNAGEVVPLEDLAAVKDDRRQYLEVRMTLDLKTSLLVRSGGDAAGDPDAVHLTEKGRAVLPGTSVGGVIRHRCNRIAKTMMTAGGDEMVARMFGPLKQAGERIALRASRVTVGETQLTGVTPHVQTRVAIDRFTQAARESKLFSEAPVWPDAQSSGHIRDLVIRLDGRGDDKELERECGLLLMALKDLWLGDLTIGGGAAVGRGVFSGRRMSIKSSELDGAVQLIAKGRSAVERTGAEKDWQKVETWCKSWMQGKKA